MYVYVVCQLPNIIQRLSGGSLSRVRLTMGNSIMRVIGYVLQNSIMHSNGIVYYNLHVTYMYVCMR